LRRKVKPMQNITMANSGMMAVFQLIKGDGS